LRLQLRQVRLDRVGKVWHDSRGKRVIIRNGLVRRAEVVVLPRAEINPEARADGRLPLEGGWRPSQTETGREVLVVGRIIRRALRQNPPQPKKSPNLGRFHTSCTTP